MANDKKSGLGRTLSNLLGENKEEKIETNGVSRIVYNESDYIEEIDTIPTVSHETTEPRVIKPHKRTDKPNNDEVKNDLKTIQEEVKKEASKNVEFKELNISDIQPNPDQPRNNFDKDKLLELADSINEKGVLQPILVRKINESTYQIIAGERRWQASQIAKKTTIPAIITTSSDNESLELALIENIQRDDLNPIEEAWGYKRLMDKMNLTQAQLAQAMSKGRSTIANSIRLLDLPENAQEAMFNNELTAGHARAILSVPNEEGRQKLIKKIKEDNISVREAESLARLLSLDSSTLPSQKKSIPASYKAVVKALKDSLNTSVKIKTSGGRNRLEISFKNEEDLDRIYNLLANWPQAPEISEPFEIRIEAGIPAFFNFSSK